jgi:hypothetical protein
MSNVGSLGCFVCLFSQTHAQSRRVRCSAAQSSGEVVSLWPLLDSLCSSVTRPLLSKNALTFLSTRHTC